MDPSRHTRSCFDVLYVGPPGPCADALRDEAMSTGQRLYRVESVVDAGVDVESYPFQLAIIDTAWTRGHTVDLIARWDAAGLPPSQVLALVSDQSDVAVDDLLDLGVGDVHAYTGAPSPQRIMYGVDTLRDRIEHDTWRTCRSLCAIAPRYCGHCLSLVSPSFTRCIECGQPRPIEGWPLGEDPGLRRLGSVLEGYTLFKLIGYGSSAVVYRARRETLHDAVAIKLVGANGGAMPDANTVQQVQRETQALARIPSPHVVAVRDTFTYDGGIAIVMDLAIGCNLREHVRRHGPLKPRRALEVAIQVAEALHSAHEHGIIHRDIKPANIHLSIDTQGRVHATVVDFGIAHLLGQRREGRLFHGTPAYAAPEQVQTPHTVDGRADVYALGGVLYFMLTGRPPYPDQDLASLIRRHLWEDFPALTATDLPHDAALLDTYNRVLAGMTAREMTERFHSMSQLGAALKVALLTHERALQARQSRREALVDGALSPDDAQRALRRELRQLAIEKHVLVERYEQALASYHSSPALSRARSGARERIKATKREIAELRDAVRSLQAVAQMVRTTAPGPASPRDGA